MSKSCKLTNSTFSWWMEVDGMFISFDGSENADYFEKHYSDLGYEVVRDNDAWKREAHQQAYQTKYMK